ncbi:ribonuclease H-like domain-containing protein [Tanacetum coccineum]|uniref:Ribonuclease H-like domain-containing protein n=1 Tax=Tanacetum coccineum TaxID=301880 RepID=A0ABQ4X5L4_9ASTR
MKRHGKTTYDVFRGRSPDISYFYVLGCLVFIHKNIDHLGKFDEKADDGFFLGYSLVAKAFRVFNIRRQEIKETYHVTFNEADDVITQTSTEGDEINFNKSRSFLNNEFLVPRNPSQSNRNDYYLPYVPAFDPLLTNNIIIPDPIIPTTQDINSPDESHEFLIADDHLFYNEADDSEPAEIHIDIYESQNITINDEPISDVEPSLIIISPSTKIIHDTLAPQERWSKDKHILLVNILGESQACVITRNRVRDSKAASAHKCLYVNFLSEIKPKKVIEALEEEGWVISLQEELNQFERNKVWTLIPAPYGKTIIGTKWIFRNKMEENGLDTLNGDLVSPVASASTGAEGPIHPKTAKQKLARKNELKAKSTLMLAILDEHLLKFHACKDAKSLWEAIKNRFRGNKESKKMQKTILKQNYENMLHQEDVNLKLLRRLPSAWNNIALIMRNKYDLDTLSMDDLYNNLKVYKSEIKGKSSSSSNSHNVAFVSSDNSNSTNETVNTAHSVSAASSKDQASTESNVDDVMFSFFSNQSNTPQLDYEDLEQIDADYLEEMDLK